MTFATRSSTSVARDVSKPALYAELRDHLHSLFLGERDCVANGANLCALLYAGLPELNWAGLYFCRGRQLVLGPFQGRVACVRIDWGRGVCGSAAARRDIIIVPNVNDFPGHIVCDTASQSEIVVPLLQGERLWGVLDLDSPMLSRFDAEDAGGLRACADVYVGSSDMAALLGADLEE